MQCSKICYSDKGYEEIDSTRDEVCSKICVYSSIIFALTGIIAFVIGTNTEEKLSKKEIVWLVISPFIGAAAMAVCVATSAICYRTLKCCIEKFC